MPCGGAPVSRNDRYELVEVRLTEDANGEFRESTMSRLGLTEGVPMQKQSKRGATRRKGDQVKQGTESFVLNVIDFAGVRERLPGQGATTARTVQEICLEERLEKGQGRRKITRMFENNNGY